MSMPLEQRVEKRAERWYNRILMHALVQRDILNLSVPERIQLVADIWDTITATPEEIELSDEQKIELNRRLDAYRKNPDEGSSWEMARERIRSRR